MIRMIPFILILLGVVAAEKPRPRIINGDPVQDIRTEYPWMASLADFGQHKCGGTLIAPDVILTAAHCMNYVEEVQLLHSNLADETENYESYLIKQKVHHPRYYANYALDHDPYDIALISFYGRTYLEPAKLNRDSSLPSSTEDELIILGWGTVDPEDLNTASDVIQQGTVKYIPNEICKTASGQLPNGKNASYAIGTIASQHLCAADFETYQDICNGDSGGPILLEDSTVAGVTSFSAECASQVFPAVYVRTSEAMNWIDDQICRMSQYELPSEYGCFKEEPSYNGDNVTITIEFNYRRESSETGWVLSSANTDLAHKSIFHYNDIEPAATISEVVTVPNNSEYILTLLQRRNYGRGQVRAYEGTDGFKNSSTIFLNERINFINQYSTPTYTFVVGALPTQAPTATPAPSASKTSLPFITIEIVFDLYAVETGWSVKALSENEEPLLLDVQYPGSYRGYSAGDTVLELVDLLPSSTTTNLQEYEFMVTDNEGDGITDGRFRVFWGDIADGQLLFENNPFEFEDVHYFLEILPTLMPTRSQAPTTVPTFMPSSTSSEESNRPTPIFSLLPPAPPTAVSSKKGKSKKRKTSSPNILPSPAPIIEPASKKTGNDDEKKNLKKASYDSKKTRYPKKKQT